VKIVDKNKRYFLSFYDREKNGYSAEECALETNSECTVEYEEIEKGEEIYTYAEIKEYLCDCTYAGIEFENKIVVLIENKLLLINKAVVEELDLDEYCQHGLPFKKVANKNIVSYFKGYSNYELKKYMIGKFGQGFKLVFGEFLNN
jgi:hypothetical protein